MFNLLTKLKNIFINPGYNYRLRDCVVVGLPMSTNNEYELEIYIGKDKVYTYPIPARNADHKFDPEYVSGFVFDDRLDNTWWITFDRDYYHLWSSEKEDYSFSLYDKTNDIVIINKVNLIKECGACSWDKK